ncbi:hypothetical protein Syn7502_03177 [Synechococcus sp. PCC 7502]|uniref:hypothetical protein n=1 Tax=Synechococcus sp. PCC 7502 TaxID=1173263 RepID=UPI00029FF868|nr:hypothetical protein [Synechococcus sp. PCC 7502]AFY75061.1 hypothetical protein Syn7502_03177 [Synechococcus sp. PCC 7502]
MFKVLAGNLSAIFNLDGKHLDRYLQKKEMIKNSICEELILHDQIFIPTQDYLTACGLILVLGEENFISLLEDKRIHFLRLRGVFGYVKGTGVDGTLLTFIDPDSKRPQDSSIEKSIEIGLSVISTQVTEKNKITDLLIKESTPLEMSTVLDAIKCDSFRDLRATSLWKDKYNFSNKDLLALPGMEDMQVRVIGPGTNPKIDPVDALLALALFNIELYLSIKFECASSSSGSPLGDLIDIKLDRLVEQSVRSKNIWSLLEINNIPDLGNLDLTDECNFKDLLKVIRSQNANEFRKWFHDRKTLDEREIFKEYVGLLSEVPAIQTLPSKAIRFCVGNGLGFVPVIGQVFSFIDTFLLEKFLQGNSPRYFIEDLKKFRGKIKQYPQGFGKTRPPKYR